MMGKKQIKVLEDGLGSSSGLLPKGADDPYNFEDQILPMLKEEYEAARQDVEKLGLTELVEAAI